MEPVIILIGLVLVVVAYKIGKAGYIAENSMTEMFEYEKMNESINKEENKTRNLLIRTLEDIGCQPEIDGYDSIVFKYQGEEFRINADDDSPIIWIYDISWATLDINDPNADFLKQAINKANENSAITNLYTANEEQGFISLHCQIVAYFAHHIPNCNEYLKSYLDSFFMAHKHVRDEFENLRKIQEQKERVEIKGFRKE